MSNDYYNQSPQTQQMAPQQRAPQYAQNPQHSYQQPYQQPHQRMPQQLYMPKDITTTGEWVLTLFLACIPIVGFILLLVWAFGSNCATSKKNWARANLIWMIVGMLLIIAMIVAATVMGIPVYDYFIQYLQRYY